jgi:hypothetical protein
MANREPIIDSTDPALAFFQGAIQNSWKPSEACPSVYLFWAVNLSGLAMNGIHENFA